MMMANSSSIKRHGGKSGLAARIVAMMPPHTRYCEAYFGSGAVLFARDGENVAEFVNDLDRDLANFWFVLRSETLFERFNRMCQATPVIEEVFGETKELLEIKPFTPATEDEIIERAWAFFVANRQSRQALGKSFVTPTSRLRRGMNEQVSAWLSAVDGLPEFHARLRRVEIRNQSALSFIDELDSPDTLFYLDPPYAHETRYSTTEYGEHEMSQDDHIALLNCLIKLKGKFILSGYSNRLYCNVAMTCNWHRVDFDLPNQASGKKTKQRKIECCWMNYSPPA
jgi:DNA adenine methylase